MNLARLRRLFGIAPTDASGVGFEKRLEAGSMYNGVEYSTNEGNEFHGSVASATCSKPAFRVRTDPKQAMTSGTIWAGHFQAYGNWSGHNVHTLYGLQAEAGVKAAGAILTGGAMVAARFKIEDNGANAAFGGTAKASAVQIFAQLSTGTTFTTGKYSLVEFGIEGNIAPDSFFHHSVNIQGAAFTKAFFSTVVTPGAGDSLWLTTKSLTDAAAGAVQNDAALKLITDTDGTPANYWIPLYNG